MLLMEEIDSACRQNGLSYALAEQTADYAIVNDTFETGCYEWRIMMTTKDLVRLMQLFSDKEGRVFEHRGNCENLQLSRVRYVDATTTLIDKEDTVRYHALGIAVTIIPLFAIAPENKIRYIERELLERNGFNFDELTEYRMQNRFRARIKDASFASAGPQKASQQFHQYMLSDAKREPEQKMYYQRYQSGRYTGITTDYIRKTKPVSFAGHTFPVPEDSDGYFRFVFGKNWENHAYEPLQTSNRIAVLWDVSRSYTDWFAQWEKAGVNIKNMKEEMFDYDKWKRLTFLPAEEKTEHAYQYVRLSRDRIDCYASCQERMDALRQAAAEDDPERLKELMEDYLKLTRTWEKRGFGFYVDEELFSYASKIWEAEGDNDHARKILSITPDAHKEHELTTYIAAEMEQMQ